MFCSCSELKLQIYYTIIYPSLINFLSQCFLSNVSVLYNEINTSNTGPCKYCVNMQNKLLTILINKILLSSKIHCYQITKYTHINKQTNMLLAVNITLSYNKKHSFHYFFTIVNSRQYLDFQSSMVVKFHKPQPIRKDKVP